MLCSNCRFAIDSFNESQPVCPACGTPSSSPDPDDFERIEFKTLASLNEFEDERADEESDPLTKLPEKTQIELQNLRLLQWVN